MKKLPPSDAAPQSSLILYQTEDGRTRIQCRFEDETIWLTQALIAELYQISVPTVNEHLKGIFSEGRTGLGGNYSEIPNRSPGGRPRGRSQDRTLQPARHPRRRLPRAQLAGYPVPPVGHGALERVPGQRLHPRRRAAPEPAGPGPHRLLRRAAGAHPRHPRQRAADVPARARDPRPRRRRFADRSGIAKNYLREEKITELNRIVVMFLDFAEDQARRRKQIFLQTWKSRLDDFLRFNERAILRDGGKITREQADVIAEQEYERFAARRRARLEDAAEADLLEQLENEAKKLSEGKSIE